MDIRALLQIDFERDAGFRRVVLDASRQGMRVAGILGVLFAVAYMALYMLMGQTPSADYGADVPVFWDKLIIATFGIVVFYFSRTEWGPRFGRAVVAAIVILVGFATAFDDVNTGNMSFTTPWLAAALMVAVGTMPYKIWQAFLLGLAMSVVYAISAGMGTGTAGLVPTDPEPSQFVFLGITTLLAAGLSNLLYRSRWTAYQQNEALRLAGEQIADQADRLKELDKQKARFFANVSHEIRTPLTLILGPIQDALQGRSGVIAGGFRRQLELARRNGERLKNLINQLLDLSKLEVGRMELNPGTYDIVSFVRILVASFASMAERKKISLTFVPDAERLVTRFDADKMEKVISNLLSNALKFTPEHGKVHVGLGEEDDARVVITVKDTGPGIPEDERALIFDRFHQVDSSALHVPEGTGIGLALARELVELHEGTIQVESDEGFGSSFKVVLPLIDGEAEDVARSAVVEAEFPAPQDLDAPAIEDDLTHAVPGSDAPCVLIVDDNEDVRSYLRIHLSSRYRLSEAGDGQEALKRISEARPSLVISDVVMPRIDGHELCRRIKSDHATSDIPVILLTARASEEDRMEGLEMGADDYLFKPFNAAELLVRVENLIEIRRLLKDRFSGELIIRPTDITVQSAEAEFLERVTAVVEEHLGDTNFGVDWLADEVGISPRQLQRRLRASTKLSAAGTIRTMRLGRAAQLLEQEAGTVSEIAYRVGFMDANYFSRLFRQTFGMPPSEYGGSEADS